MTTECISYHTPVARKTHQCDACHATITPGTRYYRETLIQKPDPPYTWRECLPCHRDRVTNRAYEWWYGVVDGVTFDEISCWITEEAETSTDPETRAIAARYLSRCPHYNRRPS